MTMLLEPTYMLQQKKLETTLFFAFQSELNIYMRHSIFKSKNKQNIVTSFVKSQDFTSPALFSAAAGEGE